MRVKALRKLHAGGVTLSKPFEGLLWKHMQMFRWVDGTGRVLPASQLIFNFQKGTFLGFAEQFKHALTPENEDIPIRLMGVTQLFLWALWVGAFEVQVQQPELSVAEQVRLIVGSGEWQATAAQGRPVLAPADQGNFTIDASFMERPVFEFVRYDGSVAIGQATTAAQVRGAQAGVPRGWEGSAAPRLASADNAHPA